MKVTVMDIGRMKRSILFAVLAAVLITSLLMGGYRVAGAAGDVGYKDFAYGSGTSAPTGQKPQSKLWYNDGLWWGVLYNKFSGHFEIYRFDWAGNSWSSTGTMVDDRRRSSADALWDGSHLYTVSAIPPGISEDPTIRVMRFSYNPTTRVYSLDTGFPVVLARTSIETVVMDKDTTGMVWVTYTDTNNSGGRQVLITHTTTNDLTWVQPYVLQSVGAANLTSDDISTLVAYNGNIGVMWSNQNDDSVYFATHKDGAPDNQWVQNPALQGPSYADDHLNIKSLQADASGQVFAAVKTSLNDVLSSTSQQPLILLLTLGQNGSWTRRTFGRVVDDFTRPIVLIDNQNRQVYVFATVPVGSATSGAIYYKQVSLDDQSMQFPTGLGTPFMLFSTDTHINNASSTKQALNSTTGLLVIAGDDTSRYYFHNIINLGAGSPTATPTATNTPTPTPINTPTNTPTPTATSVLPDTPTPTPTNTPTDTPTPTPTSVLTDTPTPTPTNTPTDTPTPAPTNTPTDTPTPTPTSTPTDTPTPTPTPTPFIPTVYFTDGFESGDFSAWSTVNTTGDGQAVVQSSLVNSGTFAAQLTETSNRGSLVYVTKTITTSLNDLWISGDFIVTADGGNGSNVPIFKLFDASGTEQAFLYRRNQGGGRIVLSVGGANNQTNGVLPLNTWAHFEIHLIAAGSGLSTAEVYLDGVAIFQSSTSSISTTGINTLQIGYEKARQAFSLAADNIQVERK